MNEIAFKAAYSASRNGANNFYFSPFTRHFEYSDGMRDCFNAGCWWLQDILACECPPVMRKAKEPVCLVTVNVEASKAVITLTHSDSRPPLWTRMIHHTDMPEGKWVFYLCDEGARFALCLMDER